MNSWRSLLFRISLLIAAAYLGSYQAKTIAAVDESDNGSSVGRESCDANQTHDVWLISTRHLGCPSRDNSAAIDLHVKHYGGPGIGWIETSLDEFFATSDPAQPTLVYVHGNRADWNEALVRGWQVHNTLLGPGQIEAVRYVIWTWPSDQIHGQIRDVRAKAARTNGEGYYFAWFISQLDPATRLSIVGYSFGARVTTGALHLLGGGTLAGRSLPPGQSPRARVALLAAAVHSGWLRPGACHEHALSQMDRLLIQYNSCDPYLKLYRCIEKHARPAALGFTGMCVDESLGVSIEQRNVCSIIGKTHAQVRYFNSSTLTDQMRESLLGE